MKSKIHEFQNNIQQVMSKTTISLKKAIQSIIVIAIVSSSVIAAKSMAKQVKHQYSMLPAGSGKASFYDMIK